MNEENLDFNLDEYEVEEDVVEIPSNSFQQPVKTDSLAIDPRIQKMEAEMARLTNALDSGKKSTYLEKVMAKYENVDPIFKQLVCDMSLATNEFNKENLKAIHEYFEGMKKDIQQLQAEKTTLSQRIDSISSDVTTRSVVRKSLEKGFKKGAMREEFIDEAIKKHGVRLEKDPAYYLRVQQIWGTPSLSVEKKNLLTGQIIFENLKEDMIKRKGSKEDAAGLKKRVEKDPTLEKAQEKVDKHVEKTVDVPKEEVNDAKTQERIRKYFR